MGNLISALISAVGLLVSSAFVYWGITDYQEGASALWFGSAIFLCSLYALVKDVRRLRADSAT
jgi:hypothetical protein